MQVQRGTFLYRKYKRDIKEYKVMFLHRVNKGHNKTKYLYWHTGMDWYSVTYWSFLEVLTRSDLFLLCSLKK